MRFLNYCTHVYTQAVLHLDMWINLFVVQKGFHKFSPTKKALGHNFDFSFVAISFVNRSTAAIYMYIASATILYEDLLIRTRIVVKMKKAYCVGEGCELQK